MFIEDLVERFIMARWCYLVGEPFLSDIEYDALEKWYRETYPEDAYSTRSWSLDPCPVELLKKYNRIDLIITLTMGYAAESMESITTWDELRDYFLDLNEDTRVSFKIDGWNTRASYYNGRLVSFDTRGRSGSNKSALSIVDIVPKRIPIMGRVAITGETSIPVNLWATYKSMTGNVSQRASVSTAIANGDFEFLTFNAFNIFAEGGECNDVDQYTVLKKMGFSPPVFKMCNSYESLVKVIHLMSTLAKGYPRLTDGLVVENSNIQIAVRLGAWEEQVHASYVTGYEEKPGMYGTTIEVTFAPIQLGDKTCSRIPMTNVANIVENRLEIGSPIAFNIRSSANSVFDTTTTHELQKKWHGKYDRYRDYIDSK